MQYPGSSGNGLGTQPGQRAFFRKVALAQLGKALDKAPRRIHGSDNRKSSPGNQKTILLIDDELSTLEYGSVVLQANGFNTIAAQSCAAAREILHTSSHISLIITDLRMPFEDGFSILSYLRDNLRFCHIPAIMLTSHSNEDIVMRAVELGASAFLTKPLNAECLLARVRTVLENTKCTVLIVTDDPLHQSILARTLSGVGIQTISSRDGEHAKDALKDRSISLAISELALDDMTGLDLMVSAQETRPSLPFVFLGDPALRITDDDIRSAGGFGLIDRPFTNIDILHAVRAVCPL